MSTYMAYMSRPFLGGLNEEENIKAEETYQIVLEYIGDEDFVKKLTFGKTTVIVFLDKEKSQNPESLWMICTPHTNWIWVTDESLDHKGEGGCYLMGDKPEYS